MKSDHSQTEKLYGEKTEKVSFLCICNIKSIGNTAKIVFEFDVYENTMSMKFINLAEWQCMG